MLLGKAEASAEALCAQKGPQQSLELLPRVRLNLRPQMGSGPTQGDACFRRERRAEVPTGRDPSQESREVLVGAVTQALFGQGFSRF